jgi:hypothetical protein
MPHLESKTKLFFVTIAVIDSDEEARQEEYTSKGAQGDADNQMDVFFHVLASLVSLNYGTLVIRFHNT